LDYEEGDSQDRRTHARHHDEFVNGIKWKTHKKEKIVYSKGDFRIVLLDVGSPSFLWRRAIKVGRRGKQETLFAPGVYSEYERTARSLVGIIGERAMSILVMRRMRGILETTWASWVDKSAEARRELESFIRELPGDRRPWSCSYLWVLPRHRGRGVARKMADVALEESGLPREKFPWLAPFTESGEAFIRSYCPGGFTRGWAEV
jgi:GNAT superfamily N-acetyltransferase